MNEQNASKEEFGFGEKTDNGLNQAKAVVGWAELVLIAEFGSDPIRAKIDTGAVRTSLSAPGLKILELDGETFAEFDFVPDEISKTSRVSLPVIRFSEVKCSHGDSDRRPVVSLTVQLAGEKISVEASLADRSRMTFPMLIGRACLAGNFLVNSDKRYLQSDQFGQTGLTPVDGYEDPVPGKDGVV